eukprot:3399690-Prymnesium_polylepis.1
MRKSELRSFIWRAVLTAREACFGLRRRFIYIVGLSVRIVFFFFFFFPFEMMMMMMMKKKKKKKSCALQYGRPMGRRGWEREARLPPIRARVPGVGSSVRIVLFLFILMLPIRAFDHDAPHVVRRAACEHNNHAHSAGFGERERAPPWPMAYDAPGGGV